MTSIYLDNAATSFPKAPGTAQAMSDYITLVGASINRSSYGAAQSAELTTLSLREKLCQLFHHPDPTHCILTPGATWSLNMVIQGFLKPGDHVLVSAMEHNAVMRPLTALTDRGIVFDRIPCDGEGRLKIEALPSLVKENTRLVILCHASNVCGTIQDAGAMGAFCHQHQIPFVLDGAQTAGHIPIDFEQWHLSALSVPGHKGLMGPQGIGALLLSESFAKELTPLITGGTGSVSQSEIQPKYMPDQFESGTHNLPGIYGLEASVSWILSQGMEQLRAHELELIRYFLAEAEKLPHVRVTGVKEPEGRVGVFSLDFTGMDNGEAAFRLDQEQGILTRCGLHCAPNAHKTLGTYPQGTVRFSTGPFTTQSDLAQAIKAIKIVAES